MLTSEPVCFVSPFYPTKSIARSQCAYVLASKLRFSPSSTATRGFIAEHVVACVSAHCTQTSLIAHSHPVLVLAARYLRAFASTS